MVRDDSVHCYLTNNAYMLAPAVAAVQRAERAAVSSAGTVRGARCRLPQWAERVLLLLP